MTKTVNKILLINPPSPFLIEERVFTPTGVLYAASELEKAGFDVEVLDLARKPRHTDKDGSYENITQNYEKEYMQLVSDAATEFDTIGVSATTPQYKFAVKIHEAIKEANPRAKTVIGGSHATLLSGLRNRKTAHFVSQDSSLRNEPKRLEELLDHFDPNIKSLAIYDHIVSGDATGMIKIFSENAPKWIESERMGKNIDSVPKPARHLIDMDSYNYFLTNPKTGEKVKTTNIMSQWGCPFPCNFCSGRDDDFYRTVRKTTPLNTVEEMLGIHKKYGYKGFMFFDDELNIDWNRFNILLVELKKLHEEYGFVYRGFVKSELVTERHPETYDRMLEAGFAEACTGVESGSNYILENVIKKNTTREINLKSAELAKKAGISFKAFTMIGHPYETENYAMQTYSWILEASPTGFDITVHQPYPGAPVYDLAVKDEKSGIYFLTPKEVGTSRGKQFTSGSNIDDAVFFFHKPNYGDPQVDSFYKGKPGEYISNVWTHELSRQRIVELRDMIEKDAKEKLGATSVSGLSYDAVMGQAGNK